MDDDGPLNHDPAARLGSRNLGGPDGLERLAEAEVTAGDGQPATGAPSTGAPSTDPAIPGAGPAARAPRSPTSAPTSAAASVATEAAVGAGRAPRRRAPGTGGPGSRSALLAGGVLLAFALVVVVGTVVRGGSEGGTDTAGRADASAPGRPGAGDTGDVDAGDVDGATGGPTATVPRTTATTAPAERAPAEGDCAWPDPQASTPGAYLSLACDDERATIRLERALPAPPPPGAHCPVGTDVVLDIPAGDAGPAELWCMRNLHPPHPGDPGQGGGELLVGDCLATQTDGRSIEVPCDGSAGEAPGYVVRASPDAMGACPAGSVGSISVETPLPGTYCVGYA